MSADRIRKLIDAAISWRATGLEHDANQAAVALSRARELCRKFRIDERSFQWPDKPAPRIVGASFTIIGDPWNDDGLSDIPIKTNEDILREFHRARAAAQMKEKVDAEIARRKSAEALRKFRDALRRQGFAAEHTSHATRLFQEAMMAAQAAKEKKP